MGHRHRRADDPGCVPDHERHLFRRDLGGGDNQIAFVFAVVIVGHDHHFSTFECADCFCDTGLGHGMLLGCGQSEKIVGRDRAISRDGDLAGHVPRYPDIRIVAKGRYRRRRQVGPARECAPSFTSLQKPLIESHLHAYTRDRIQSQEKLGRIFSDTER